MPFLKNGTAIAGQREDKVISGEDRLRGVIDAHPDGIMLLGVDGAVVRANPAALDLIAAVLPAKADVTLLDLADPEFRAALRIYMEDALSGGVEALEFDLTGGKGEKRRIEVRLLAHRDEPAALLAICRDVSEQRRMEAQLRHVQKMEAIGTLSGGIAHDINNILTAIIGYANVLKLKLNQDNQLRAYVEQILASSERATSFTQSLLAFSRKTAISLKPVEINEMLRQSESMLRGLLIQGIDLTLSLTEANTTVVADIGQLEQLLINLISNACDAMPDGGSITITTGIRELGDEFIHTYGFGKAGSYLVISVSDSGTGMDERTRQRIFEPFFTTKEIGRGTGLGLAIAYGVVKQHHGYIICFSEQGRGTTFDIYLPSAKMISRAADSNRSLIPAGGSETILLAEADPEVRTVMSAYLRDFGYTLLDVDNGEDAVRLFQENRDRIHLLLLDLAMPKKDGKETCDAIRGLSPGIKVLFISGFSVPESRQKAATVDCILKPVSPETLLTKVREVLDR
ncbi:MAG TPA: ATP-binding protein [Nitrospirota bacterium]|nr:ATP-binding protein [Nitrospirota bacterium]